MLGLCASGWFGGSPYSPHPHPTHPHTYPHTHMQGPTGVGKTELAKALAAMLFDSEKMLIRWGSV